MLLADVPALVFTPAFTFVLRLTAEPLLVEGVAFTAVPEVLLLALTAGFAEVGVLLLVAVDALVTSAVVPISAGRLMAILLASVAFSLL